MAAITWSHVTELEPGLSEAPTTLQTTILAYVHEVVGVAYLGGEDSARLKMARALLAAHLAKLAEQLAGGQTAGPVTSRSMGGISKGWASAQMSDDGLQRTGHGSAYLLLIRSAPLTQGLVV